MRYIGNKRRLLPFIHDAIKQHGIRGDTFCDLFAGTATVGQYFKKQGYRIISNDSLYVSYLCQYVRVKLNTLPTFQVLADYLQLSTQPTACADEVVAYLNQLTGIAGYVYQHYSLGGTEAQSIQRLYFTDANAQKIDVIRETLEQWHQLSLMNQDEYSVLLYALLVAASHSANTTATTNGFFKDFQARSLKPIQLVLPEIVSSPYSHQIHCDDAITLLDQLPMVDILYLDPPYVSTQYADAYHLLETIARWDDPLLSGALGKRDGSPLRSPFSQKRQAIIALENIVASGRYDHLLMSYSNDSLIPHESLMPLFQRYGEVTVSRQPLRRYNTMPLNDSAKNRRTPVEERLYYLKPFSVHTTPATQPILYQISTKHIKRVDVLSYESYEWRLRNDEANEH